MDSSIYNRTTTNLNKTLLVFRSIPIYVSDGKKYTIEVNEKSNVRIS